MSNSERATILVVDDEPANRALVRAYLEPTYEVQEAADGARALETLARTAVHLVLLDVMMPKMSGIDVCRQIKTSSGDGPYQPVILLTALDEQKQRNAGLEAGADDFLTKPVDRHELLLRIRTFVMLRRQDERIRAQVRDLTERDRLIQQQLGELQGVARVRQQWAEELQRANNELEAFSYSVSHDLRAPLRTIDGFGTLLQTEKADLLDDEGRSYLERIRAAATRMSALIDDLLNLSRITRSPVRRKRVNLTDIARRVLHELQQREPSRAVVAEVEEGLAAHADPGLLTIALENLLGNAWKFTSRRPGARISVGQVVQEGRSVFFVRDEGAGFDPSFADRLFQPFQRLHSQAEFGGTGIGLAIVNRIASCHGGRVWAESAIGKGATFFFTVEKPE
jgi:signal transduction histidine kinase